MRKRTEYTKYMRMLGFFIARKPVYFPKTLPY